VLILLRKIQKKKGGNERETRKECGPSKKRKEIQTGEDGEPENCGEETRWRGRTELSIAGTAVAGVVEKGGIVAKRKGILAWGQAPRKEQEEE